MIHVLKEKTTPAQVQDMLQEYEGMIWIFDAVSYVAAAKCMRTANQFYLKTEVSKTTFGAQIGIRVSNALNLNH